MSEANLNLTVGCLIQTFPIDALFKVKASSHELVDDLKEHILHTLSGHLERTPHRTSLRLRKFYPYQIPDAEYLEDVTDMSSLRYLPSYQKLSSVFGEPPPMDDQPLHAVLEVAQLGAHLFLLYVMKLIPHRYTRAAAPRYDHIKVFASGCPLWRCIFSYDIETQSHCRSEGGDTK